MAKALDGITVVELASHLACSYAAMLLAEQGARAIRIEPPAVILSVAGLISPW
jgi:crotonobetainyl-CoA:carnitine CoA-transferase CaiB-like acyl-CoA transferase